MILARLESWSLARVSPPVTTFQLDPCSSFCQPVEYNFKVLYKCKISLSNDVFHTKLLDYCCSTLITQVERVKNNVHGNQHVSRVQNKVQNILQFALCSALPWWAALKYRCKATCKILFRILSRSLNSPRVNLTKT